MSTKAVANKVGARNLRIFNRRGILSSSNSCLKEKSLIVEYNKPQKELGLLNIPL